MYMDRTLQRLGPVIYVQNVYKLLLYKCTQNQFTVHVYKTSTLKGLVSCSA